MEKVIVGIICVSILGVILAINVSTMSKLLLTMMTFGMLGSMVFEDDVNQAHPARPAPLARPTLPASLAPPALPALPASLAPPALPALPALPASLAPPAPLAPPASLAPPVQQYQSMAAAQAASLTPLPVQHPVHDVKLIALARKEEIQRKEAAQGGISRKALATTATIASAWMLSAAYLSICN